VLAGQGTAALEFLFEVPQLDVLLVPVGGGGLIAGCSLVAKTVWPGIEIAGVETEAFPSLARIRAGLEPWYGGQTVAEGIAVKSIGRLTRAIVAAARGATSSWCPSRRDRARDPPAA
jgi:threonine dehydratase